MKRAVKRRVGKLTKKLNSKVTSFTEQSPLNDDLFGCVESIPHDEGQAYKRMQWKGIYRFRGMGMKTENKRKLGKLDSYMSERISTNKTTRILTPCAHVADGPVDSALTRWRWWMLECNHFSPCSSSCSFSWISLPPAENSEAMETRRGRLKGGRADGLYPLPAWFHLCTRWDPILPPYCTLSDRISPSPFANPHSMPDIYNKIHFVLFLGGFMNELTWSFISLRFWLKCAQILHFWLMHKTQY